MELANSLLTTVNWSAWYANTTDTFGTLAAPTRTLIGSGSITVNTTATRYYVPITLPAGATTGLEIEFSVGAQTSGTWTIGEAQLVAGSASELWREQRPLGMELGLSQRYLPAYRSVNTVDFLPGMAQVASATLASLVVPFPVTPRVAPTGIFISASADFTVNASVGGGVSSAVTFANASLNAARISLAQTGMTAGQAALIYFNTASGFLLFTGCEL